MDSIEKHLPCLPPDARVRVVLAGVGLVSKIKGNAHLLYSPEDWKLQEVYLTIYKPAVDPVGRKAFWTNPRTDKLPGPDGTTHEEAAETIRRIVLQAVTQEAKAAASQKAIKNLI